MRSYIFTPRERRIIQSFLGGDIAAADSKVSQIRCRVRKFEESLSRDINLFLKLRSLAESKTA